MSPAASRSAESNDLEPIRLNYLNDKLRLDAAEANRNSPVRHLPSSAAPLVVTVGLGELFSILEELARPNGAILAALKELALIR